MERAWNHVDTHRMPIQARQNTKAQATPLGLRFFKKPTTNWPQHLPTFVGTDAHSLFVLIDTLLFAQIHALHRPATGIA